MKYVVLQIQPWDQLHYAGEPDFEILPGERALVQMESGIDLAQVVGRVEINTEEARTSLKTILRKATQEDAARQAKQNESRHEILKYCQETIQKYNLDMKLVDCHIAYDGGRIIFGFIAEERIDFRELVKELTRHFQKTIRLQQMGIRDEARLCGDVGPCGCELCCRRFLKQLTSVVSDYAKIQGVEHRGCERLSGICGRLKCCLTFELKTYQELAKNLPPIGTTIKTAKGPGQVLSLNILRQSANVRVNAETIIEVSLKK